MRIGYKAIRVLITYPRSDNLSVYEPELPIWKPLQNLRGPTTMPVGGKLSLTGLRDDTPNHIGHHGAAGAEGAGGTRSPTAVPVGGGGPGRASWRRAEPHVSTPGAAGVEGVGGSGGHERAWLRCPWAVAGPGRASRRRAGRSSRRGRLAGGPPPTGTPSSPARRTACAAPGTPAGPQATPLTGRVAAHSAARPGD